jgi:hypothetical protein
MIDPPQKDQGRNTEKGPENKDAAHGDRHSRRDLNHLCYEAGSGQEDRRQ